MKTLKMKSTRDLIMLGLVVVLSTTTSCQQKAEKATSENNSVSAEVPSTPIQEATFFGNIKVIKAHVAAKSDLNAKDAYGSTPLHIAATFGRTDAAKLLIESGANINATSADGSTPLHTAAFYGRVELVKALLAKNADTSVRNSYNSTALESVTAPFEAVKPIYDQLSKDLGPLGLKLDYEELQQNRLIIADLIKNHQ